MEKEQTETIQGEPMTEEDEEFNRIEREVAMKQRKYDDDDIQEYVRPWVGLTDEERNGLWRVIVGWGDPSHDDIDLMKAIEATLRKKNEM